MWQHRIMRVRGVMASSNSRTISAGSSAGTGIRICFRTMPSRRSRCRKVVIMRP